MKAKLNMTQWMGRLENGSTGEDAAYLMQTPVMFGVLVLGIMVAMVGFWRMGSFMGSEKGAYQASTASSNSVNVGRSASSEVFREWSNDQRIDASSSDVTLDSNKRSTHSSIKINKDVTWYPGTTTSFSVNGSSTQRWERFYGGPPKCSGSNCKE